MRIEAGEIIGGRYRLEKQLGAGGMGAVWAATHTVTNKAVAMKFLHGHGDDLQLRERLLREARAVCSVMHPHVVPVHDVLELEGGAPALVMDLLTGESLGSKLERVGKLPHEEVTRIAIDVLSALEAAHAQGIVHRDLKPDNVFLARTPGAKTEDVKVLDFGIAKVTTLGEGDAQAAALTRTDAMVGTPYYMAPEQVYGEKDIDARSDLWSMGIMMYECLAGVRPTEAANLGQIFKLVTIGPIPPIAEKVPEIPPSLAKAVQWCLERDRAARPPNATALREALERVLAGSTLDGAAVALRPSEVAPASDLAPPAARASRKWGLIAAGAMVVVATIAGGGTLAMRARHKASAAAEAPAAPAIVAASAGASPTAPASAPVSASESPAPLASAPASASASPAAVASAPAKSKPSARPKPAAPATAAAAPAKDPKDERAAGKVVVTPPF